MAKKPSRAEAAHWASAHGSDADYLGWLSFQPSCIDGAFGEWHDGVGRNVACHVRTVEGGAGTGCKPVYMAIPLTDAQHKLTHQHGNSALHPPEWWAAQAALHLKRWVRTRYKCEDGRDFRD